MAANQKDYADYSLSVTSDRDATTVKVVLTLNDGVSVWRGFRHLTAIGSRLDSYLKDKEKISFSSMRYIGDKKVILEAVSCVSESGANDALHSLYLFMEHPEKYA